MIQEYEQANHKRLGRENFSNLSKCDSDRRLTYLGGNPGGNNHGYLDVSDDSSDRSNPTPHEHEFEHELRQKRKRMRSVRGKTGMESNNAPRGTRNQKERVATANNGTRRGGHPARIFARKDDKQLEIPPTMKHTESKLDLLYERLKQCEDDGGIVDPAKVLNTMNMV